MDELQLVKGSEMCEMASGIVQISTNGMQWSMNVGEMVNEMRDGEKTRFAGEEGECIYSLNRNV